jgi:hypothetical protein
MRIITELRYAKRSIKTSSLSKMKISARKRHRRWARVLCGTARRAGDADFHRGPFLTDWDVS